MMRLSVIIATLNRQKDLERCLDSIFLSSLLPYEVIVVEQGDVKLTREVVGKFKEKFNVKLFFLERRSLSLARNFGLEKSSGDVLCFFDDDITIEKSYLSLVCKCFEESEKLMGLNGRDLLKVYSNNFFLKLVGFVFNISLFGVFNKVLRSGQNTFICNSERVESLECLSGCNMCYRRDVFSGSERFCKDFIKWCFGEDVFFSYRVYKRYGRGSLKYFPFLRMKHFESVQSRMSSKSLIKMKIVYRYIFWKREVYDGNFLNFVCYVWSQFGLLLVRFFRRENVEWFLVFRTYVYLIRNYRGIDENRIDYNDFIESGD